MAVKLVIDDPKKDQLVPVDAFKKFAGVLDLETVKNDSFMEKMFQDEKKRNEKKEKIKAIAAAISGIKAPENKRAWFAKFFLVPFEGKASKEAKELFEAISKTDGFKELVAATDRYNQNFKANTDEVANAAKALSDVIQNTLTPATAQFAEAYKAQASQQAQATPQQAAPAPAGTTGAPVAPPPGTLQKLKDVFADNPNVLQTLSVLGLGDKTIDDPKTTSTDIINAISKANDQQKAVLAPLLQQVNLNINSLPNPEQLTEKLKRSLDLTKKLYEFGFIDKTEYLAAIVKTKKVLAEAQPAAAPAAQPVNPAQQQSQKPKDPILSGLSTLTGQNKPEEGELVTLSQSSGTMQQAMTDLGKSVIAESLSLKQKKLVKLNLQKQILSEYLATGEVATKTQLNEFFLMALLLAALAGVVGWAIKTLGPILKNSLTGTEPSGRSTKVDSAKQASEIASAVGAGYSPNGQITDASGKTVPDPKTKIEEFKKTLAEKSQVIAEAVNVVNTNMQGKTAPPPYEAFKTAYAQSPANEINRLSAALDKVVV